MQDAILVHHVDLEAMRLEPASDRIEILLRQSESLAEFLGRQPVMEIRRRRVRQFINELPQFPLLLR